VEILAQSSAAFALTQAYNFQGTHILGASRGHLSDSVISLLKLQSIMSGSLFLRHSVQQ